MNNFRQQNEHLKELILKQETYSSRPNLIIRGLTLNCSFLILVGSFTSCSKKNYQLCQGINQLIQISWLSIRCPT